MSENVGSAIVMVGSMGVGVAMVVIDVYNNLLVIAAFISWVLGTITWLMLDTSVNEADKKLNLQIKKERLRLLKERGGK